MALLLYGLTALLVGAGLTHFVVPGWYERLVPPWIWLPRPRVTVYLSGLVEIVLAVGLVNGLTRVYAAWATVALFAVYVASHGSAHRRADAAHPRWPERPSGTLARVVVNLGYLAGALTLAVWLSIPATATEHAQPDQDIHERDPAGIPDAAGPPGDDEVAEGDPPQPGHRAADDADAPSGPPITFEEEAAWFHGVVDLDGDITVLFTRRTGENGESEETLYAHRLADGEERPVAVTGGIESGLDAAAVHDGRLLLSTCHLRRQVVAQPPMIGGDDLELLVPPEWYEGLAVAGDRMVQLERPFDAEGNADPMRLLLHDLSTGHRPDVALPVGVTSVEHTSARVDLSADGTAMLISFVPWDGPVPVLTVVVVDLDGSPQVIPVETRERLVFAR